MQDSQEVQIAKEVYHSAMAVMKFTLDLEEQKYIEHGRNDDRYKFFKKQLMSFTYDKLRELFKKFESANILTKTGIPEDVKDGYKPTLGGGSGFVNSEQFDKLFKIHKV